MAPLQIQFSYTPRELWEAGRFAPRASSERPQSRALSGLMGWLVFIGLSAILYATVLSQKHGSPGKSNWHGLREYWRLWPWILLFGLIWVLAAWSYLRKARANSQLQNQVTLEVDDAGVRLVSSDGDATRPWSEYIGWSETNRLIFLRFADDAAIAIPKRAADADELERLRLWAREHAPTP